MRSNILRVSIFCLLFVITLSLTASKLVHEKKNHHNVAANHHKLKPHHSTTTTASSSSSSHKKLKPSSSNQKSLSSTNDFDFEMEAEESKTNSIDEAVLIINKAETEIGDLTSKMAKLAQELESAKKDLETIKPQAKENVESSKDKENVESSSKTQTIDTTVSSNDSSTASFTSIDDDSQLQNENENEDGSNALEEVKSQTTEPATAEIKAETKTSTNLEEADANEDNSSASSSALTDNADEVSFVQIPDEMNSVDDDDSSAPVLMAMKRHQTLFAQQKAQREVGSSMDDSGFTFGSTTDGSGRTFDINEEGSVVHPPPATAEDEFTKIVTKSGVDAKDRLPNALNSTEATDDNNVVCVCKRHGAPRGFDRIRCKRNPTPTPTPTPLPKAPPAGIKQCANGTWAAGNDRGTSDVICIYFPAEEIKVVHPPTPTPLPLPYPAECYDDRNEWVAEGVEQKAREKIDVQLLVQQGYESCGCE